MSRHPSKRHQRSVKRTTLIVVEGPSEKIFVKHIISIFGRNSGTRVTIEPAFGGSGDSILKLAVKMCSGYDSGVVLYDGDRPPTKKSIIKKSHHKKIKHIVSYPAIEATLLAILGQPIPKSTLDCKSALGKYLNAPLTNSFMYQRYFPEEVLRDRVKAVQILRELMDALGIII